MRRCWLGLLLVAGGCWSPVTDLVTSHVEAGGTLSASLDSGPATTSKGIADATASPMTMNATSSALVFGLVIGTDINTGGDGTTELLANTAVTLSVSPTSATQMSVHLNGQSCAATTAVVHVTPDGSGHLGGDFSGSGAGCTTSGTFTGIPIDKGD